MTCEKCGGTGRCHYPNTATYNSRPGILVGHAFTWDICDLCWGSGNEDRPYKNLRKLNEELRKYKQFYVEVMKASENVQSI